jgi:hypothetical protein
LSLCVWSAAFSSADGFEVVRPAHDQGRVSFFVTQWQGLIQACSGLTKSGISSGMGSGKGVGIGDRDVMGLPSINFRSHADEKSSVVVSRFMHREM